MPIWIWFPLGILTGFALGHLVNTWRSDRVRVKVLRQLGYEDSGPHWIGEED